MKTNVMISIHGRQRSEEGEESIELVTNGEFAQDGENVTFSYMESEVTGMDGTRTTFIAGDDVVTMLREGTINSRMVFQRGRKHVFVYDTPYGSMTMGVDTRRLQLQRSEDQVELELEYAIDVDNIVVGTNSFKINVKDA